MAFAVSQIAHIRFGSKADIWKYMSGPVQKGWGSFTLPPYHQLAARITAESLCYAPSVRCFGWLPISGMQFPPLKNIRVQNIWDAF